MIESAALLKHKITYGKKKSPANTWNMFQEIFELFIYLFFKDEKYWWRHKINSYE